LKDLAVKWAKYNIRVNAIAPGWFETQMTKWSTEERGPRSWIAFSSKRSGGREDLKGAVVFLASKASDYNTGQVLCVDGGLTACSSGAGSGHSMEVDSNLDIT
jgi:gluconate 5-dehydrogenase